MREAAGLFDLSHMGEVRIAGTDAAAFLDYALVAKYSKMKIGKAKYGVIVNESGGLLDDLITYRIGDEEFLIVPNASNTPTVVAALKDRVHQFVQTVAPGSDVHLTDESDATALIAVQGPNSEAIILRALDESGHGEFGPRTGAGDQAKAQVTDDANGEPPRRGCEDHHRSGGARTGVLRVDAADDRGDRPHARPHRIHR